MLQRRRHRGEDDASEVLGRVAQTEEDPAANETASGTGAHPGPVPETQPATATERRKEPFGIRLQQLLGTITRPAVAGGMIVFGTATMIVAWLGTAGRTDVAEQLTWFVGAGIPGLAFVLLGGIWIADHEVHRATTRLNRFERDVTRLHRAIVGPQQAPAPVPGTVEPYATSPPGEVLVVPHGETYHRANCLVIRDKADLRRYERDAVDETLRACVVCAP